VTHSRLASVRATRDVLVRHGLQTKKSLGQHFLVDDNIVGRIIALADLSGDESVLEVGPGIGTLTVALCQAAGSVVAVEQDRRLMPILGELAEECGNLTIVHADAAAVSPEQLVTPLGPPVALVANLPYSVAATVVLRYFELLPSLRFAVVMVQAEVADRMTARPGTKAYGSYTVKLGLRAHPAGRFAVAPGCFMPPPRVDSAVVRLEREPGMRDTTLVADAAAAAVAAFAQRRKTIRNSLRSTLSADAATLERALADAGIDPGRRAETLDVQSYVLLGEKLREYGLLP
jgi:16S rRNA (adenine1518-N6/adenine1519-N6)-dimethyltransferase